MKLNIYLFITFYSSIHTAEYRHFIPAEILEIKKKLDAQEVAINCWSKDAQRMDSFLKDGQLVEVRDYYLSVARKWDDSAAVKKLTRWQN